MLHRVSILQRRLCGLLFVLKLARIRRMWWINLWTNLPSWRIETELLGISGLSSERTLWPRSLYFVILTLLESKLIFLLVRTSIHLSFGCDQSASQTHKSAQYSHISSIDYSGWKVHTGLPALILSASALALLHPFLWSRIPAQTPWYQGTNKYWLAKALKLITGYSHQLLHRISDPHSLL
jgi:hypothetical protein